MTDPLPPQAAPEALAALAERLSMDLNYMASVLSAVGAQERLDAAGLASLLGLPPLGLTRLALCKRPSANSPEFAQQVRQIAQYAGVEPGTLARIIRQADALEAMKTRPMPRTADSEAPQPARWQPGWLAAARDRDETDNHPDQEEGEGPPAEEPEQ